MRTAEDGVWLRAAVLGLLLTAATVLAATLGLPRVDAVRTWVDGAGGAAWTGMVLGVALVLMAPVPRTAVSVLVGVVLGFGPGLALALAGGLLAGLASFGLSRTLGRAAATRLGGRRLARVDELVTERGFVAVLAGRLLPVMPFVVLSYGAGLTAIRWAPYALATALGLVPSTVVQVGIGASAGVLAERAGVLTLVSGAVAVLLLGGWALLAWRRREPAAS
ncbi:TVP38/TMEM64 family protein [Blastococcus sp. CT_GayMR20]|uniref:TVP38/TMEM64 family protein n=1 Tax=Blastococcus sp. CT_GayMR20 TaxID=2559609 RepID=UPI00107313FA|nr:VTT domain-containing protein [Blastococcus sp. CT_GayMR20]TFV93016.1 TVP38/TMEM64 family protein [Blastococcus sp. CT_GayMR20]